MGASGRFNRHQKKRNLRIDLKQIVQIILLILTGGFIGTIMILASLKGIKEDKAGLSDLSYYTGKLSAFHIDYKKSSSTSLRYKFIALTLPGMPQTMAIYRPGQNYEDILNNIRPGDEVAMYYRPHSNQYDRFVSGINFNSDIYQISINRKTYLQIGQVKSDHQKANIPIIVLGVCIYLITLYGGVRVIRKSNEIKR